MLIPGPEFCVHGDAEQHMVVKGQIIRHVVDIWQDYDMRTVICVIVVIFMVIPSIVAYAHN